MTGTIIPFPRRPHDAVRHHAAAPNNAHGDVTDTQRQALRHDGVPLRAGDAAAITGPHGYITLHRGVITEVTRQPGDTQATYAVMCTDGIHRSIRADRIRSADFINRHTGEHA